MGERLQPWRIARARRALCVPHAALAWFLAATLAGLAGCGSRSGSRGGSLVGGVTPRDLATQTATAVVLTNKWSQVLYDLQSLNRPAAPEPQCTATSTIPVSSDTIEVEETTFKNCVHLTLTKNFDPETGNLDYQTGVYTFPAPDTRVLTETDRNFKKGRTSTSLQFSVTREYLLPSPDKPIRDTMSFTFEFDTKGTDLDNRDDTQDYRDGQVKFQSRADAKFSIHQTFGSGSADAVTMAVGDGSSYTLGVPVDRTPATPRPKFGERTSGSFASEGTSRGRRMEFELSGASTGATMWNHLTLNAPDGSSGDFVLNSDFSGRGQFSQNGRVTFSLSFGADGITTITPVGGGEAVVAGPSAAALAFLLHAWRELAVRTGPRPGG